MAVHGIRARARRAVDLSACHVTAPRAGAASVSLPRDDDLWVCAFGMGFEGLANPFGLVAQLVRAHA